MGIKQRLDRLKENTAFTAAYMVFFALGALALSVYYNIGLIEDAAGPSAMVLIDVLMLAFAVISALAGAYLFFKYIDQERHIQFLEGEKPILASTGDRTYIAQLSIGDQDTAFEPIPSRLYLTNLGILAQHKASGEAALFIAHDMIVDYSHFQNGIRIRFTEPNMMFNEILLIVDDLNAWMQMIGDIQSPPPA